jgi:hypothetical protein
MNLTRLSDQELLTNTKNLVNKEREVLMEVLHHLREIEKRRLYADLGQPSLFAYCENILNYSAAQADRRIKAMRLIKELPQIEQKVSSGELSLTNAAKAKEFFAQEEKTSGPIGTQEKLKVLADLENKSTRVAEKILLAQASTPAPEVKERVRQVSASIAECKFGADEELMQKMNRLRGRLAHKNPKMSMAELVAAAFELALEATDPTKGPERKRKDNEGRKNVTPAPESTPKSASGRKYISVKTKRAVWGKAQAECENCGSGYALEIDHTTPVGLGGSSGPENLRLLCRNCNQRAAITKLGQQTMDKYLS